MTLSKMPFKFPTLGLESALACPEMDGAKRPSASRRLWRALVRWWARRRPSQATWDPRYLDDRLLADIGLRRGEPAHSALTAGWSVIPTERRGPARRRDADGWDRL
jgi:hypothetical protein